MRVLPYLIAVAVTAAACQPANPPEQRTVQPATAAAAEPAAFFPVGHPAGSCVTEAEIAAEQTIHLDAALSVTAGVCRRAYQDPALIERYQAFAAAHEERLSAARRSMSAFLGRHQGGDRDQLLDVYLTLVEGEQARGLSVASEPDYCRQRRDRFYTATEFGDAELDAYVDRMVERHRGSYRGCG